VTDTIFFHMLSCAMRGMLTFIAVMMLYLFPDQFKKSQRVGLAVGASGSLMTIPILYAGAGATPFDGWATTLLTAGWLCFLWSYSLRLFRHNWANVLQVRSMRKEIKERRGE